MGPALSFDLNKYLQPHKLSAEFLTWTSSRYSDVRLSQGLNRALCYCFTWQTYFNEAAGSALHRSCMYPSVCVSQNSAAFILKFL